MESAQQPAQEPTPTTTPAADKPASEGGEKKTNTLAILSLVFAFLVPLVGFILAIVAMGKIKKTGEGGKGLTIAALIISVLGMILSVLFFFTVIMAANEIQDAANELEQNSTIQFDGSYDSTNFDTTY